MHGSYLICIFTRISSDVGSNGLDSGRLWFLLRYRRFAYVLNESFLKYIRWQLFLVEAQCWMTLKDLAKLIFVQNIKPKLPMEEDELTTKIEQCLEGLRACGRKLILRPTTTFAQDIAVSKLYHLLWLWGWLVRSESLNHVSKNGRLKITKRVVTRVRAHFWSS